MDVRFDGIIDRLQAHDTERGMLRNGLLAIGIVALVIPGAGAAGAKTGGQSPLFGDDGLSFWAVTDFANGAQVPDAIFHFEGQSLSLDIPCYRRSWAYRYEADVIRITNPHGSESRCNGETPPIIEYFDSTIQKVKVPEVNGDRLSLLDADGRPLFVLNRLTATGLENRKWQISSFFDGRSLVSTRGRFAKPLVSEVTFMHGSLIGSPGCGAFFGNYSLHGQRATIAAVFALGGSCPPGEFDLGAIIGAALTGDRTAEQDGERLVLRDPQGRAQIVLTPWEKRGL